MDVTVEELRKRYQRLTDEALAEAYNQGKDAYLQKAWQVISDEMESRGILTQKAGTAESSHLTTEEAQQLVGKLLQSGSSNESIRKRLQEGGLLASEADELMAPLVKQWKDVLEKLAQKKMRTGALWAAGGLAFTLVSYAAAARSGGIYFITWGAVLYGVLRLADGVSLSLRARRH